MQRLKRIEDLEKRIATYEEKRDIAIEKARIKLEQLKAGLSGQDLLSRAETLSEMDHLEKICLGSEKPVVMTEGRYVLFKKEINDILNQKPDGFNTLQQSMITMQVKEELEAISNRLIALYGNDPGSNETDGSEITGGKESKTTDADIIRDNILRGMGTL